MKEIVLAHLTPHPIIEWGVIVNDCFYYLWQYQQSLEIGVPVEKFNCGFIYYDILMKMRPKNNE